MGAAGKEIWRRAKGSSPIQERQQKCHPTVQLQQSVKIHMTSKPNKLVVKRIRLDELYATAVPDRPSNQRLRKSNFGQLPNLSRLEIKKNI